MSSKTAVDPVVRRSWSLAARLTAWYAGSSFALVLIAAGYLYWAAASNLDLEDDHLLGDRLRYLQSVWQNKPGDLATLRQEIEEVWLARQHTQLHVRVVKSDGSTVLATPDFETLLADAEFPEPTHVVLADYFAQYQTPRWADEGIAVFSEPVERRTKLREWLNQEAKQGRLFSLNELTQQRSIPQDKRLGELFYAQSAAFVEFLLTERKLSEPELLRFVADSATHGFPEAARRQFLTRWRIVGNPTGASGWSLRALSSKSPTPTDTTVTQSQWPWLTDDA